MNETRPDVELARRVDALMAEDRTLEYRRAVQQVMKEDPVLADRYINRFTRSAPERDLYRMSGELHAKARDLMEESGGKMTYKRAVERVIEKEPELAKAIFT